MTTRTAELVSASLSLAVLWLEVAVLSHWLMPQDGTLGALLIAEAIATGCSLFFWWQMTQKSKMRRDPATWVGAFFVAMLISLVFVEMDCGGSLRLVDGSPTCSHYGGGISIVFTFAALALTAVALPNALRAWLLTKLDRRSGHGGD